MKIDILTLFPKMFAVPFEESMIKRAQEKGLVEIKIHDLRDWAEDERGTVDDKPYGGGPGMVMMVEPVYKAVQELKRDNSKVLLMTPQGKVFKQEIARELSKLGHLVLIAVHY